MGHGGEFQQNMIQGEVNHSSILDLRTHKQYEKAKRYLEFKASKADEAWLFLKIDKNPNISVETRKGPLVSHLNSSSVCIILPSLV